VSDDKQRDEKGWPLAPAPQRSDYDAQRRTTIAAAEGIMHSMLGYLPDEPGDARKLREIITAWLQRDAVKNNN